MMMSKSSDSSRFFSRLVFPLPKGRWKDNLSRKSQISAQIFIYLIAIILFSFILIYGYNAVKGFRERSEQVAYIKFKTDLTSTVERVSPDYGTLKREEFFIGGEYSKVCLVQNYKQDENRARILNNIKDPIINDSIKGNVNKNVFLFTIRLQESFDVGEINVSNNGYLCVPVMNGKVKMQFEGKGNHAYISTW